MFLKGGMGTKAHSQEDGIQLASQTPTVTQEKPLVPLIISRIQRLEVLTHVSCGREEGWPGEDETIGTGSFKEIFIYQSI